MATRSGSLLLQLKGVQKHFGRIAAVKNASFQVKAGEVVGFLGPNGAGKTTTIRMILQQIQPNAGVLKIFGRELLPSEHVNREIGFLGSDMAYEEGLTGRQYLEFVNSVRGGGNAQRMHDLAQRLDIDLSRRIRTLSRGNKQKIGLIAAVMHRPKLLIMDEPTSGFDPLMQQVFADLLREHTAAGGGALISSHILGEVQHTADRVVFIADGTVLGEQNVSDLLRDSPQNIQIRFATATAADRARAGLNKLNGLQIKPGKGPVVDATYRGATPVLLTKLAALKPTQCLIQEPDLEAIFMQYYSQPVETQGATR